HAGALPAELWPHAWKARHSIDGPGATQAPRACSRQMCSLPGRFAALFEAPVRCDHAAAAFGARVESGPRLRVVGLADVFAHVAHGVVEQAADAFGVHARVGALVGGAHGESSQAGMTSVAEAGSRARHKGRAWLAHPEIT